MPGMLQLANVLELIDDIVSIMALFCSRIASSIGESGRLHVSPELGYQVYSFQRVLRIKL
jgi:hypothetical protein